MCYNNNKGIVLTKFNLQSEYNPAGDQPTAIKKLVDGINDGLKNQVLLGVTGSGKTYTMANIIEKLQRPALVIAHNKTLAAQLCNEFRGFFPDSAVEYFVSYYDYYQPEAYIPSTDTYIEKDSSINDEIDKLRHSATSSLQERRDVIVVASVSCIYSLGDPKEYLDLSISLRPGMKKSRDNLINRLVEIRYERNDIEFTRGNFRVRGDVIEIFQSYSTENAIRVEFFGDEIERISDIQALTGRVLNTRKHVAVFPATHYATSSGKMENAIEQIRHDMFEQVRAFEKENQLIEAQRLSQRTYYDIEMMQEIGYCSGIENYSRYFDGRKPGEPSFTLMDYFPDDFIVFIDESNMTIPQIRAMFAGDKSRKNSLVNFGFRLTSAYDNRPLTFDEFKTRIGQTFYVSATPAEYEIKLSGQIVEQVIRPTGLIDPEVSIKPVKGQIDDLLDEIRFTTSKGYRTLVTTLTKKMSESLTDYLKNLNIKVQYLHSDIKTLERIEIIKSLRMGEFDVIVGINLLREGLDIPEVALVAILDADKEGFLRSETSLIQTIGRAARNVDSRVIMYADKITRSMKNAIDETNRRRDIQIKFNKENNIIPTTISSRISNTLKISQFSKAKGIKKISKDDNIKIIIEDLEQIMLDCARSLDFETAAKLRDDIFELREKYNIHEDKK